MNSSGVFPFTHCFHLKRRERKQKDILTFHHWTPVFIYIVICLPIFVDRHSNTYLKIKKKHEHSSWNFNADTYQMFHTCIFPLFIGWFVPIYVFASFFPWDISKECRQLCLTSIWSVLCKLSLHLWQLKVCADIQFPFVWLFRWSFYVFMCSQACFNLAFSLLNSACISFKLCRFNIHLYIDLGFNGA